MSLPKIAIIGAGPGGLTLANILQRHQIPSTVFDLDASRNERNQGGTLDLHPRDGQLALREAGLWDQFARLSRPEGDVRKIVRYSGEVLWDDNGTAAPVREEEKFDNRPEIDRAVLKDILLDSLAPEVVKWGKKLREVVPDDKWYDLTFVVGSTEMVFDLVVGADGAWSYVRPLLTAVKPHYSGISTIEMWALDVNEKHPWISKYVGNGSCFVFDQDRAIQSQRIGDGSIRTYASLRLAEPWVKNCGIDWTKPTAREELVRRHFSDCGADLQRLILESADELVPRTLYMLPVGFCWEPRSGVTLIGDAAHLMTPFAGVGVNAAMADALALARAIIGSQSAQDTNLTAALESYEHEMFLRAEKYAQKTMDNLNEHFSAGGSDKMVERLKRHAAGDVGR
jgi:2-polyprenyl-6-methoxyphenol hydroxylase-like FAD-dependent oxidoreductase